MMTKKVNERGGLPKGKAKTSTPRTKPEHRPNKKLRCLFRIAAIGMKRKPPPPLMPKITAREGESRRRQAAHTNHGPAATRCHGCSTHRRLDTEQRSR